MFDGFRATEDPGFQSETDRLSGSIKTPHRRRITAGRLFGIAIEIAAGLVVLVAVIALVA
jgi:hypothetical protein